MIRGIILYYLNIKPTHGYEIQQFINFSGIDQWINIQSGSIYYALTKLEKEKNIAILREERTGSRVRKIYEITEKGRETLVDEMRQELRAPLFKVGSPKFVTSPILDTVPQEEAREIIDAHIKELQKTKDFWKYWEEKKAKADKYDLTKLTFKIAIDSLEQQIAWHEELLEHLEYYTESAKTMSDMIASIDFEKTKNEEQSSFQGTKIDILEQLKNAIEKNPQEAMENIDLMIEQLKK